MTRRIHVKSVFGALLALMSATLLLTAGVTQPATAAAAEDDTLYSDDCNAPGSYVVWTNNLAGTVMHSFVLYQPTPTTTWLCFSVDVWTGGPLWEHVHDGGKLEVVGSPTGVHPVVSDDAGYCASQPGYQNITADIGFYVNDDAIGVCGLDNQNVGLSLGDGSLPTDVNVWHDGDANPII